MSSNGNVRQEGEGQSRIAATKVAPNNRLLYLPTFFKGHFMWGEARVYYELGRMCPDYEGGYWEFFTLSNGGFYMAPAVERTFVLQCEGNGFKGELSADAAGAVATLMTLNTLSWHTQDPYFTDAFYWLRDFALEHEEAGAILGAID